MSTLHDSDAELALVIGVGNDYRHDDAAGLAVVRQLKKYDIPGVRLLESDGDPAKLLELWKGVSSVILVDAVASGATPGTIHWLDVDHESVPSQLFQVSSHGLGVAQAIELARALKQLPAFVKLFGIEGRNFEEGEGISKEVAESIPAVASCIQKIVEDFKKKFSSIHKLSYGVIPRLLF